MRAQRLAANNSPTIRRNDGGARCVYALKLNTPGMPGFFKWYVGITENLDDRYEQHRIGRGAEWTKLYPPVEIDDHICSLDPFIEDLWTKRYMMMYGTDNVRGGSYVRIILPPEQHISLLQEFRTAANQCSKCGSPYHFTTRCNDARAMLPHASAVTPVGESRNMVLMDSIAYAEEDDAGKIVVAGSHGGRSSGRFAIEYPLAACFLNDAGVGKDNAGIASLAMLDELGRLGATYDFNTARIGDARDAWTNGVISHVNEVAARAGFAAGEGLADAIRRIFGMS